MQACKASTKECEGHAQRDPIKRKNEQSRMALLVLCCEEKLCLCYVMLSTIAACPSGSCCLFSGPSCAALRPIPVQITALAGPSKPCLVILLACGVRRSHSIMPLVCNAAGGARRASAVEARSLLWTAFARRCARAAPAGRVDGSGPAAATLGPADALGSGGWDADAQTAAAVALAMQPPYVACLDSLDVQACPHSQGLSVLLAFKHTVCRSI